MWIVLALVHLVFCIEPQLNGRLKVGIPVSPVPPFSCPQLPVPPPATDVTKLHPGNIKAVMSLGDSITAGFAMKGIPAEYRGLVFSIGGDEWESDFGWTKAVTIPNFLKQYRPDLAGMSFGETVPLTGGAYLNGAVSGAKVEDVPGQIDYLVRTLKTTYKDEIDFENDWKLLTLFIGANNLCISCESSRGSPTYFEHYLRESLTKLRNEIPRVFVNLVTIFNISGVWNAGMTREYCRVLWEDLGVDECPCLVAHGPSGRGTMDFNAVAYNKISQKLADEFSSQTTKNTTFTVVVQPGLSGFNITEFGEDFLSGLDCFHPDLPANVAFTIGIWNNMQTPPGQKATTLDPNHIQYLCPTEDTVFQ